MNVMKKENNKLLLILTGLIKLARPKQWIKNGFVLAPLIFSGLFTQTSFLVNALFATLFFCIASSATYIVNDYNDIKLDKKHPIKSKTRPLASGEVTKKQALFFLGFLYTLLIAAFFYHPKVLSVIAVYLAINFAYTLKLKHQPVVDIFILAFGFVLRVYAGAVALSVPLSSWMFITTLCLALYLASVKRQQELINSGTKSRVVLHYYSEKLLDKYIEMSSTGTLLFYSLFVMTSRPKMIITIPIVLFGLFRYWYITDSKQCGESPTDALYADLPLALTILTWVGVSIGSLWP